MSLHPMTLSTYLSSEPPKSDDPAVRHCFHKEASVGILSAILDGIEYLHSQKIVHRDLKPANIFLSIQHGQRPSLAGYVDIMACSQCTSKNTDNHIYITPCIGDFGLIAEIQDSEASSQSTFEPSPLATLNPQPVGTHFYRPSSMPTDGPIICEKLDVYSLGVIAFELIHKFGTKSERATLLSNLNKGILPDGFMKHEMAIGIKSMVCDDRDHRWNCAAVRNWLQSLNENGT